jgi:hypothetical protein
VIPRVAEVVFVQEATVLTDGLKHRDFVFVDLVFRMLVEQLAVQLIADREAMQV